MWRKGSLPTLLVGMKISAATIESSMDIPPKTLNIELPYDPAVPFLDLYSEKNMIQKDTYSPMFIAALFTTAKKETTDLESKLLVTSGKK